MMERVRMAMFSVLGAEQVEGAKVLDLYAGTGAIGIEALSRGADQVDFVEADRRRAGAIEESLRNLAPDSTGRVYWMKAERALSRLEGPYDIVFVDPPFSMENWDGLMERASESAVLTDGGTLVIERPKRLELGERYGGLVKQQDRNYGDVALSIYTELGRG